MEYLLGVMVLVGVGFAIYFAKVVKDGAIFGRDRDDLMSDAKRRDETERIDAERDKDLRTGSFSRLRDLIKRRVLRKGGDRKDTGGA